MVIASEDGKRIIRVGSSDILFSVYSTIMVRLKYCHNSIRSAIIFLKTGKCFSDKCMETAREFNLIRDALSQIKPEDAVYDFRDLQKEAPWKNNLSEVITSCANLFTSSDGRDLLFEIVSILCYGGTVGQLIQIQG